MSGDARIFIALSVAIFYSILICAYFIPYFTLVAMDPLTIFGSAGILVGTSLVAMSLSGRI